MASDANSIRDLIDEVKQPFITAPAYKYGAGRSLRERIAFVQAVTTGTYDYTADLAPDLQHKIASFAHNMRVYRQQGAAAMRADLKLQLEPRGAGTRIESMADDMEVFEARLIHEITSAGRLVDDMRKACVSEFFWAGILEKVEYVAPERREGEEAEAYKKRARAYREGFLGYRLVRKPSEGVAWTEGDDRQPTLAVCEYELPFIDLLERFGKRYNVSRDNPSHALKVFDSHFGSLRGSLPQPDAEWGSRDCWQQVMKVCFVDDGSNMCYYIEDKPDEKGKSRYAGIGDTDYKNTFGRCSLILVQGVYNDGWPIAYRREPILMAMINIEHEKAQQMSTVASRMAGPIREGQVLPPEVALEVSRSPDLMEKLVPQFVDARGRTRVATMLGEYQALHQMMDPYWETYFGNLERMSSVAAPRGLISDPQAREAAGRTPSSTFLADIDEHDRLLAEAQQSIIDGLGLIPEMVEHDMRIDRNAHRKKGDKRDEDRDWDHTFMTTGKEPVYGKHIERGRTVKITPQMLDGDFIRTITPVDNRESVRAAKRQEAEERWVAGTITHRERLELHGIENPTEFDEKKNAEEMYQYDKPRIIMAARDAFGSFVERMFGPSPETTVMAMSQQQQMAPAPGQAAAPNQGPGGTQVLAPMTSGNGTAGVEAQAVT